MIDWFWGCIFLACLIVLITISELVRKHTDKSPEVTRKVVHIITGIFVALTPMFFSSSLPMLIIAGTFGIVNFVAIRLGKLTSYNGTGRISYGTVYYPFAFFILTALFWHHSKIILITSMLILALADASAAIVGRTVKRPISYRLGGEKKSIQGSAAMFIVTLLVVIMVWWSKSPNGVAIYTKTIVIMALLTAVIATVCEAISYRGSDNLTVPIGSAFVMHLMIFRPELVTGFTIGMLLAAIIALISYKLRFLSNSGTVATFLLGTIVFGIGGWNFALPILSFFILSSLISKLGKKRKKIVADTFEKSSQRDMWQVWANGGVGGIIVLLHYLYPHPVWYYLFLASVAAATADTWGTEIGVFSKFSPRHILTFRRVPTGTSGGVTLLGSLGGIIGSLVIASHLFMKETDLSLLVTITLAGFIGSIFDSIAGATIQAQYQCPTCNKYTEKILHCNQTTTKLTSGYAWINNDIVNTICTISAAIAMWGLLQFII
ncbi:DUF92 domain-containing protein [candidate division KSB1 bacterium]|nr:DUF92 domain-containing protein [candidate division KSB1 bacterium]